MSHEPPLGTDAACEPPAEAAGAPPAARWPERIVALGRELAASPARDDLRGQLWTLLAGALLQAARSAAATWRGSSDEELRDLASQKAFDLMRRYDRGEWNPGDSAPGQLLTMIQRVARNGLVDAHRRRGGRWTPLAGEHLEQAAPVSMTDPGLQSVRREFAEALVACAGGLRPVHRTVWMFRVFLDLPARDIAVHPDVALHEAHVNVILQRSRQQIRTCMSAKGHDPRELPPGCFAALWSAFRAWTLTADEGRP